MIESPQKLRFWAAIRARVTTTSAPALAQLLTNRQGAMDEALRREVIVPLAWVAFRFAPERSPYARLQVAALLTLMSRGEVEVEQFLEHLEHFAESEELDRLTAAPTDQLELEIVEGLRDRRSGDVKVVEDTIPIVAERLSIPQPASEELAKDAHSAAWALIEDAIAGGQPVRDLALRCANNPDEPGPIRARAWAEWARRTDDDSQAIDGFRRALELELEPDVVCELADRLALRVPPLVGREPLPQVWSAEADEAVETARRALRLGTSKPALAYRAIALARESQGRPDEALRALAFAIAHADPDEHPNPRILAIGRLRILIRQGHLDDALAIWTEFIARNPSGRRVPMLLLAYLQVRRGSLDEALASATDATEQDHGTMALLARGHVHALRGEWEHAKADLDRFLTCPHSVDEYAFAHVVRAWVNEALGAWEAAVLDLTRGLDDAGWKQVATQIDAYAHDLPPDRGPRTAFEAWRCQLLAHLLPELEHPTILRWRAQLDEGAELGSVIAELTAAVTGDDRVLRQAVRNVVPAWARALALDRSVAGPLRELRRVL
jgi:tetratricopeptide (TPR) repeat protein